LRLQAASTEAGFLAAFTEITSIPTFVVIHNGELQVQLKSDASKEEFINSIRTVLGAEAIPGSSTVPTPTPQTATTATTTPPSAKARGKQKATPAQDSQAEPSTKSVSAAQQAARDALRRKKKEEAEELARVKARIEADKAARRAQAEARKAEREQEQSYVRLQSQTQPRATPSSRGSQAKNVNLNIRLFDGRTIRSSFPRTASLEKEIRRWVDDEFSRLAQNDATMHHKQLPPYYFRHILSPQPSRELSAGDESQELGAIDLAPSATLVLVPVKGYTDAYAGASGGGVIGTATGLVGGALGLFSSTVGFVGSTLGSLIGLGATPAQASNEQTMGSQSSQAQAPPQQAQAHAQSSPTDVPTIRVRTLADQRAREPREQQFYNGNQLSTEPRNDDDDKRDSA